MGETYWVVPEYKVVVSDLQTFLADLRLWMEQLELDVHSSPSGDHSQLEREVVHRLGKPVLASLTHFFEKAERIVEGLEEESSRRTGPISNGNCTRCRWRRPSFTAPSQNRLATRAITKWST